MAAHRDITALLGVKPQVFISNCATYLLLWNLLLPAGPRGILECDMQE